MNRPALESMLTEFRARARKVKGGSTATAIQCAEDVLTLCNVVEAMSERVNVPARAPRDVLGEAFRNSELA
jgi:hypothetical protein